MHKFSLVVVSFLLLATSSSFAQKIEAGIFLDYLGISQTSTSNFGLGARFGYRVHRNVLLEGEFAYDYGINFDEAYRNVANGNITAIERTHRCNSGSNRTQASAFRWRIPPVCHAQRRVRGF